MESNKTNSFRDITAGELVAGIKMGWNLGNTFDAHGDRNGFPELECSYAESSVPDMEAAWVEHVTTRENIDAVKAAGFNAIRFPVSWYKACDADINIRADWMARVKEVVGFAVDNDMIISVDSHHDETYFSMLDKDLAETKRVFTRMWEQIAVAFRDYNEKLILEGLNEPRTVDAESEWYGTPEEHNNLNILNQLFIDTVRKTGSNNEKRILMIPTIAASSSEISQKALVIPNDIIPDKIIVSIHAYEPYEFALEVGHDRPVGWNKDDPDDTLPITEPLDLAYDLFVSRGIPVIMGEMGALNRNNIDSRVKWAEFYTAYAKSKGIPCFWWDPWMTHASYDNDGYWEETFGILNRKTSKFDHPGIVEAMLRGTE